MNDLIRMTAAELGQRIAAGEVSSEEAVRAHLDRIEAADGELNAFLHVSEQAIDDARAIDSRRASGEQLHALAGVPVAMKDVLNTTTMPTTSGSRMLDGWMAPHDATVVARMREAGLVLLGKTNMDEFAMGSSTEHSGYGPTRNPWNSGRVPGGSGGGSAAAVAALEAPLALGSDTGGSIRQPSAFTGTVGVKPTYGAVSRNGAVALASSLDQVGPVARTVLDAALAHDVIGGHDPLDATSLDRQWPSFEAAARAGAASADLTGVRVGIVKQLESDGIAADVRARFQQAVAAVEGAGGQVVEIDMPSLEHAVAAYYLILPAEASSNLARFDSVRYGLRVEQPGQTVEQVMSATRGSGFGPEVKRRVILGTYALSAGYYDAYYGSAQKVRTLIQRDFDAAFEKADILISPAAPSTAFAFGEKIDDPLAMYANDVTTIPANLAGTPAMSIPMGLGDDGLPTGLQVLAPMFEDERMYRHGATIEALLNADWGGPLALTNPALEGAR